MSENKLQTELEKLRREVTTLATPDEVTREKLNVLINDIEKKLDKPADAEHHRHLMGGIKDAINQFEADHPRATAILNDIMVTLSNMGI